MSISIEVDKAALEDNADIFVQTPAPTNLEEMVIANSLSTLFLFDFIVKFASVILQNAFAASLALAID
ncbi:hypothetical protein CU097_004141 [Rhizopus azygosporus]|uniref:Uncharacterized protein n=1 Tax=Rhizopus azygosporus TaxID=86630 RepID=A0A367JG64_RHIAZ|nr:hypothetical protein CU097_004141 [Rhizopus azygosporus]